MSDITLCSGEDCPLALKCYRVSAGVNPVYQSWFTEPPYKDGKCEYFWDRDWKSKMGNKDEAL